MTPEHMECLEKILPAAHVGEHPVHAFGQPVSIQFGGILANRCGVEMHRAQGFKKQGAHF